MKKYLLLAASLGVSSIHPQYIYAKQGYNTHPQQATVTKNAPTQQVSNPKTAAAGTVTFHGNGGNGSMQPVTGLSESQELQLPRNTFTRSGYRFVGWTNNPKIDDPIFQDECPNFSYFSSYNTDLYAVWEPEKTALQISFNANGGSGSMEPIYVRKGQYIIIPPHRFTPAEEGYECKGYGSSPDDYNRYRIGGQYKTDESCTLYAFWSAMDGSVGGASEEYKGKTVFFEGVNIAKEDWVVTSEKPLYIYAEWKKGCGWYDAVQGWLNFCWAGAASNAIHWWLDRNKEYIDRYRQNHNIPVFDYRGKGDSDVFKFFAEKWTRNEGSYSTVGFNWFVNGIDINVQESAKGQGGLFRDVFGDTPLTEFMESSNRRTFNKFVQEALKNKRMITIDERNMAGGHGISCWGFDFDEDGYVCALYYSDSATPWDNTLTKRDLSLSKIAVKYHEDTDWSPYMATEVLIDEKIEHGEIPIIRVNSYDQGTEKWEAYFAAQGQEKYNFVCQDATTGKQFDTQTISQEPGQDITLPTYPFRTVTKAMAGDKELTISPEGTIAAADTEGKAITLQYADKLPFEVTTITGAEFTDAHWYQLSTEGKNGTAIMQYDAQAPSHLKTVSLAEGNLLDESTMWCISGSVTDGFKLYNKKAGTATAVTYTTENGKANMSAADQTAAVWKIVEDPTATTEGTQSFCFQTSQNESGNNLLSFSNGEVVFDKTSQQGTALNALTQTQALPKAATAFSQLLQSIPNGAVGEPVDRNVTVQAIQDLQNQPTIANYQAVWNAFANATSLNTDKAYYLLGTENQNSIAVQQDGFLYTKTDATAPANSIFLLEPAQNGRYNIQVQDEYVGAAKSNGTNNNFGLEGRSLNGTKIKRGEFALIAGGNARFYLQNTNTEAGETSYVHLNGQRVEASGDQVLGTQWYLVEAPTLTVTIGPSGYATAHFPFAVQLPQDGSLQAYTGTVSTEGSENRLILNELSGNWIPAHTAVILKGEAKSYTLTVSANENVSATEGSNDLDGSFLPTTLTDNDYILANKDGVVGFYRIDTSDPILGENKAYLPNSSVPASATGARCFIISFNGNSGGTTGIGSVSTEVNADEEYYDLQGRRVLTPAEGVYVTKSGKKVLIGK